MICAIVLTMEKPEISSEQHQKQRDSVARMSVMSLVSFYGAAVFGVGTILNNIRQKFHTNFVLGYGETRTPFTPIVEKYNGKQFMPRTHGDTGLFDKLSLRAEAGELAPAEYLKERDALRNAFRKEVDTKLMQEYAIPTASKFKDWTVGTLKRWQLMGTTSRIDASLGFASVTAFSVAAISLLHHNRRMLERVEKDIDDRVR